MSALPLTVLNISAALGRILVGSSADRVGPVNALFVAVLLSGLTQLVVWMFVTTYAGIVRGLFLALLFFFPALPASRLPLPLRPILPFSRFAFEHPSPSPLLPLHTPSD